MRTSVYDSVKLVGAPSVIQNVSGSSAVNGAGIDTIGMTDAALHVAIGIPSGSPTGASFAVVLQEAADNATWTPALDNTSTAIGATVVPLVGATGTTVSGSPSVTAMSSVAGLTVGAIVTGTGITAGTVVTAIGTTTITLSVAATASNSGVTLSFTTDFVARIEGLNLNRKRYLRAVVTPTFTAGTSPAAAVVAEIVQGGPPQQYPVNATVSST